MESGLVSVIVASYNHREYLKERMDSLINQTYQNLEILVVDDCSTDGSLEVLRKFRSHPKVRLIIRKMNGGWVNASNQGVDMSKGEFIIFANCDDTCEPQMLEKLVQSINKNPTVGISYCRSKMIDHSGKLLGDDFLIREKTFRDFCNTDVFIPRDKFKKFLLNSCVIPNLSAALFRKNCYILSGRLTSLYTVCADWDLFFRVTQYNDIAYVSGALNSFRQHKTTIRNTSKEQIYFNEVLSLLLTQIAIQNLTLVERLKFRFHVMYLWAIQIARPSYNGFQIFLSLSNVVFKKDSTAIVFLPIALAYRVFIVIVNKLGIFFRNGIT
jgi:glycosyltransferase involved in cell wall biosynthesis